jgi:hypothetical protein
MPVLTRQRRDRSSGPVIPLLYDIDHLFTVFWSVLYWLHALGDSTNNSIEYAMLATKIMETERNDGRYLTEYGSFKRTNKMCPCVYNGIYSRFR